MALPAGILTFTSCLAEIPPFLPVLNDADETMLGRQEGMEMAMAYGGSGRERGVGRPLRVVMDGWLTYDADYVGEAMTGGPNEHGNSGNSTYFTRFCCCYLDQGPLQARETWFIEIVTLLRAVCCREQLHWLR
jgi:hypothetical protein